MMAKYHTCFFNISETRVRNFKTPVFTQLLPHRVSLQPNSSPAAGDKKHTQLQLYFNPIAISEPDFTMSEKEQKYGLSHRIHTRQLKATQLLQTKWFFSFSNVYP